MRILPLTGFLTVLILSQPVFAHPGNTASDGCHYCRTNCDKWGEAWGERHCHGGYTAPAPIRAYTPPPVPRCPANSDLIGSSCVCRYGYAPFGKSCVKIPANAHAITSATEAWVCDYGYIEKGNNCVPKPVPVVSSSSAKSSSESSSYTVVQSSSSIQPVLNKSIGLPSAAPNPPQSSGGFWNRIWSLLFGS